MSVTLRGIHTVRVISGCVQLMCWGFHPLRFPRSENIYARLSGKPLGLSYYHSSPDLLPHDVSKKRLQAVPCL